MMYCVPTYHQPPSRENFNPSKNYDCRNHNGPHENLVYIEPAVIILPYNRIHFYDILEIDHGPWRDNLVRMHSGIANVLKSWD